MMNRILGVYFASENFTEEYTKAIDDASEKAFEKHSKALDKFYNMKIKTEDDKIAAEKLFNIIDDAITEACNSVGDALYKKGFYDAIAITGFKGLNKEEIESVIENEREKRWEETYDIVVNKIDNNKSKNQARQQVASK